MKIFELAKELDVTPKDLIAFYRNNDYQVSSHMQNATDDMIDFAKAHMTDIANKTTEIEKNEDENTSSKTSFVEVEAPVKTFKPDDEIL